jgi:alpha-galactosidase
LQNAQGWSKKDGEILVDEYGRPKPNEEMYPSSKGGAGMRPLAEALAKKGLRLGLWFMRGVPRPAVAARLPIKGSTTNSTALDAVRFDKARRSAYQLRLCLRVARRT